MTIKIGMQIDAKEAPIKRRCLPACVDLRPRDVLAIADLGVKELGNIPSQGQAGGDSKREFSTLVDTLFVPLFEFDRPLNAFNSPDSGMSRPSSVTNVSAVLGKSNWLASEFNCDCQSRDTGSGGFPQVFKAMATGCNLVH